MSLVQDHQLLGLEILFLSSQNQYALDVSDENKITKSYFDLGNEHKNNLYSL